MKRVASLLFLLCPIVNAQVITETFGTGANAFSIDFVQIGNPGNAADTSGSPNPVGSVEYIYNLGKYEISRDQINKANLASALGITMSDMSAYGGNRANRPATCISWYEAARFVNYLNTSKGGVVAYKFDAIGNFQLWSSTEAGYNANNMFRNSLAKYAIASSDEWYKGAYGRVDGSWSNFPNGNDYAPMNIIGGTDANTAVYDGQYDGEIGPADINNAGGLSAYGTMAQGGNVWEWIETAYDGNNNTADEMRDYRGGAWFSYARYNGFMDASDRFVEVPDRDAYTLGFRIVSLPEPSALSLLAVGLGGLAIMRRRRS